jgi:hypothetical protein
MAMELPVIATPIGEPKEMVEENIFRKRYTFYRHYFVVNFQFLDLINK